MGLSAMFRRPKAAAAASSQSSTDGSVKEEQRARHIKRRPTASGSRTSEELAGDTLRSARSSKDVPRITSRTPPTSDASQAPTPKDSLGERWGGSHIISLGKQQAADSDMFGLYRLTTPPLDPSVPQLKEIDPFEDSPPPRRLTDFEDPVYIPPLTLAATLADDYGAVAHGNSSGDATKAAAPATASTFARSQAATTASGPLDLLSEFNASYNYLFGTLPSDAVHAAPHAPVASSAAAPAPSKAAKPSRAVDTGLVSPVSSQAVSGRDSCEDEHKSGSEDDAASQGASSISEDSVLERELEDERRKEEERKAAEQRNRRRELIKQQVAFERMKERHRRQVPGQQGFGAGVARWQKELASAVAPPQQQQAAMYASSGAIGHGCMPQAQPPHHAPGQHAHMAPRGGSGSGSAGLQANASMPNIAYLAEPQALGQFPVPHATLPRHPQQPMQQCAAGLSSGLQAQHQPQAPPATPFTHPVKLAGRPQRARNPYLSDSSSDDGAGSDGDELDSDDMTSIGSSDISCDPPLDETGAPATAPLGITSGGVKVARSVSQPMFSVGASDSSSDTSAKSQSSSTRRVRFHETVSVVFNTRHTVTGEDLEHEAIESDSDSSNASVDLDAASPSRAMSGDHPSDEAFDDSNAYSHSRYQIPTTIESTPWHDEESTTMANSKETSGNSSRNASPDSAKKQRLRPKHRIETQPLRDREAERELRKHEKASMRPRPTPSKLPQAAAPAPEQEPAASAAPPATVPVSASEEQKLLPADQMAEARRLLLGHYNIPNPSLPVGSTIPRSGNATTTVFARTSSVKVIQPPSFARPKQRPLASNSQLNIRPASVAVSQPQRQAPASAPRASCPGGQDDFSDGDDVPLSAIARSKSEPMSNPPPRHSADSFASRRFFGRNQPDAAGNPVAAPNVEEHVAKFEQMRSLSMDIAAQPQPATSSSRRRFGRWGNFF
ncbi:hypothetical protein GGI04_001273 [Coemansia thaxteri]|nr:hypothetical protein GGI04_001273 [Coemansia thaxteri]